MRKTMKKSIIVLLLLMLTLSTNAYAYTMYALDGRTIEISYNDADAWRNVGWYDAPVTTMYAPDGRTEVIYKSDVAAWERVGWYDGNKIINIYSPDGRTIAIYGYQLQSYKDVGWYDYPVVYLYSSDGRSILVDKASIPEWNKVGWYTAPASGKSQLLGMLYGTWIAENESYYAGVPFMDFYGDSLDRGWSYEYYSYGTIMSVTLVGNNTYKVTEQLMVVDPSDFEYGKYINHEFHIYYEGGSRFTEIFSNGITRRTWKYVGSIDDMLRISMNEYN